ncbi:purine catabolism regulator [Lipingzhangella halophila]|uniref:Purine catabolism regulator n=1 Tax=Lipingzhangella halophila TaxID=1783352 RepID=A0A7W7RCT9_9ACTN|nr:PucR family transcriptional regulator [Lipingzhangella halophila]MBB4929650.1 purine catabolism regulator [Lipingzhangella halophila]
MPPTVQWLFHHSDLRLRPLVAAGSTRPIRWVHTSELKDPTEFLSGGELLLTTGLHSEDSPAYWDDYVKRLVARDVAGLGFGAGFSHAEVPDALVAAARQQGFPLAGVPREVPFVAISEAVGETIARERAEGLSAALDAQRDLVTAGLSPGGPQTVVGRLAQALDCRVLALDEHGGVRYAAPTSARRYAAQVRMDLDVLSLDTPMSAASLSVAGDQVSVWPIGHGREVGGYLAVGRATPLSSVERAVAGSAVGLLALDLSGERAAREALRRERLAVLHLALSGNAELAGSTADVLGVPLPEAPMRVVLLGAPRERVDQLLRAAEDQHKLNQAGALVARYETRIVAVLLARAEGDLQAVEEVLHLVPGARAVASEAVPFSDIPDAMRRVRSLYVGSPDTAERLLLARDVATAGLLGHLDTAGARGWAEAQLEPLKQHARRSQVDLVSTLHTFLQYNGHIDASSTALGIHRHTMRYRLGRIAALLDTSLDDPTVRAELWLALRVRELS